MHWSAQFSSVPYLDRGRDYRGLDCWGLVWLVYRDVLGISIPEHGEISNADLIRIAKTIRAGDESAEIWRRVAQPREFNVVVMQGLTTIDARPARIGMHVGVMIDPFRLMHTEAATGPVIVRRNHPSVAWRISGFYEHIASTRS